MYHAKVILLFCPMLLNCTILLTISFGPILLIDMLLPSLKAIIWGLGNFFE